MPVGSAWGNFRGRSSNPNLTPGIDNFRNAPANARAGVVSAREERIRSREEQRQDKKDKKKKDKEEESPPGSAHVDLWGKDRPERCKGVASTPKSEEQSSSFDPNTFYVGIGGSSLQQHFGVGRVAGPPGLAINLPKQFGFGQKGRAIGLQFPNLFGGSPAGKARAQRGIVARRN